MLIYMTSSIFFSVILYRILQLVWKKLRKFSERSRNRSRLHYKLCFAFSLITGFVCMQCHRIFNHMSSLSDKLSNFLGYIL